MIEMPEDIDYNIKVTHHCQLINMNDDPFGRLYEKIANSDEGDKVSIDIKRQEVNMTKEGLVSIIVFYDRYEKIAKPKSRKKTPIEKDL
jgi:hypothetical protein